MHIESEKTKIQLPQTPKDFLGPNNAEFMKLLEDPIVWSSIPLLNYTPLHQLKDCTIVRFRGMIQDMLDPEIYLERYEVKKKNSDGTTTRIQEGKYRDCLLLDSSEEVNYDSESNVQGERRTLFVVSIPGINDWTRIHEETCNQSNIPVLVTEERSGTAEGSKKRSAPTEDEMETDEIETEAKTDATTIDANKRQKVETPEDGKPNDPKNVAALATEYLLNSPIPERPSKACMIKIYKDFDTFTLNTVIDVIGFLSVDPSLDATSMEVDNFDNSNELQAQNPPPSLIPRLHAIAVHNLPHVNPLMDAHLPTLAASEDNFNILSVQKDLRMLLTLCLFNDDLAADYLLSHLISTVYSRCELQSIGKFSLNVCNIPKETLAIYTKQLYEILELLIPASHYLPMTLETMNTASFVPK